MGVNLKDMATTIITNPTIPCSIAAILCTCYDWIILNALHRFNKITVLMMTSSNWNIFRVSGNSCGESTGHWWILLTKASDAELRYFLWSAPWINGWVNNREAGDLIRHRAHDDVIVMIKSVTNKNTVNYQTEVYPSWHRVLLCRFDIYWALKSELTASNSRKIRNASDIANSMCAYFFELKLFALSIVQKIN